MKRRFLLGLSVLCCIAIPLARVARASECEVSSLVMYAKSNREYNIQRTVEGEVCHLDREGQGDSDYLFRDFVSLAAVISGGDNLHSGACERDRKSIPNTGLTVYLDCLPSKLAQFSRNFLVKFRSENGQIFLDEVLDGAGDIFAREPVNISTRDYVMRNRGTRYSVEYDPFVGTFYVMLFEGALELRPKTIWDSKEEWSLIPGQMFTKTVAGSPTIGAIPDAFYHHVAGRYSAGSASRAKTDEPKEEVDDRLRDLFDDVLKDPESFTKRERLAETLIVYGLEDEAYLEFEAFWSFDPVVDSKTGYYPCALAKATHRARVNERDEFLVRNELGLVLEDGTFLALDIKGKKKDGFRWRIFRKNRKRNASQRVEKGGEYYFALRDRRTGKVWELRDHIKICS